MRSLVLTVAALLGLQGCAATELSAGTVSVLALWTGTEKANFERIIEKFEREHHIKVDYVGTRAFSQVLQSEVQKGTPPDIAILPTPGEFAAYVGSGDIKSLQGVADWPDGQYSRQWRDFEKAGTGQRHAVTVKADIKSAVWYRPGRLPGPPPATFDQLEQLGATWCAGLSATPDSGWPGSDWIEDILLHQSGPDVYAKWVTGQVKWSDQAVSDAWQAWGRLMGRQNARAALLTEFADAGRPMFTGDGCLLDHQASFIIDAYQHYDHDPRLAASRDFDFFPFPPATGRQPAQLVSADLAGMFRDTPQARELMRFLTSADAQSVWAADSSGFSVNRQVGPSSYQGQVRQKISALLTSETERLCFDASDLMSPTLRTAFYRAVLEYVDDPAKLPDLLSTLESVRRSATDDNPLPAPCG